jgi:hypothetical protein
MADKSLTELIRVYFKAYETKDRSALESTLSDVFTFTSPHEDHIDCATYLERCWPNSKHTRAIRIRKLFDRGNEAFVLYDLEPDNGQHGILHWKRRQDRNDRSIFRFENRQSRGHQVTPFRTLKIRVWNHAVPAPLYVWRPFRLAASAPPRVVRNLMRAMRAWNEQTLPCRGLRVNDTAR